MSTKPLMLIRNIRTSYGLPRLLLPVTHISTQYTLLWPLSMLAGYKDSLVVVVCCSLVVIMMLEQSQFNVNHDFYLSLIFLANKTKNAGEKKQQQQQLRRSTQQGADGVRLRRLTIYTEINRYMASYLPVCVCACVCKFSLSRSFCCCRIQFKMHVVMSVCLSFWRIF